MPGDGRGAAYRNSMIYSSKPNPEQVYQSIQIEPKNEPAAEYNGPASRNPTEDVSNFRDNIAQQEQQFMDQERNFTMGGGAAEGGADAAPTEPVDEYANFQPMTLGQDDGPIRSSFD